MHQRLPIALVQVKSSNTSKNLLINYSLYQAKEIPEKVHNSIMSLINL